MLVVDETLKPEDLLPAIRRLWELSGEKIARLDARVEPHSATPVFTVEGRYTAQGWTEWTRGFHYGSALLQFEATGDDRFLDIGKAGTLAAMPAHVTHFGVHDHGFNIVSTYGNLRRLIAAGRLSEGDAAVLTPLCELALRCSGAVQARRWTTIADGSGYIHSFNGPHSLFADTIRSLRSLAVAHTLGHEYWGENDTKVSLLRRLVEHARNTIRYNVYFGTSRDAYDERGRTAHESLFDVTDGNYRCPSTQQGYSPFSTWTRGQAWVLLGCAEQVEFLATLPEDELEPVGGKQAVIDEFLGAAQATADHYLANCPTDGIPFWDTGAPGIARLADALERPSGPFNDQEPVDSSAAAIGCQGLLRLGVILRDRDAFAAARYHQAGLTVLATLLAEPYLATDPDHEGLILHAIYHRPRGWDHVPPGRRIPCGEACAWGDYHAREAALWVQRVAEGQAGPRFFDA